MIKKWIYSHLIHFVFPNKGVTHIKRTPKLVVSLTSHPGRINVVDRTIDSILRQSLKPDYVILWLAESQFPQRERSLPRSLKKYIKHGLLIKWCEDIRSYKKLIPALKMFPNDIVVTADDDLVFEENWLEALYVSYIKYPDCIHGHHAYFYQFDDEYNLKKISINNVCGQLQGTIILGSGAGILFPPQSLYNNCVTDEYMSLAPSNDDMWWWAMAKLNQTPMLLIENKCDNIICIEGTQKDGLWKSVNSLDEVTKQFKNIINHYPALQAMLE